jgi:uncharacterized membrane protein
MTPKGYSPSEVKSVADRKGAAMRTFVRFLASAGVIVSGVLLVVLGCSVLLLERWNSESQESQIGAAGIPAAASPSAIPAPLDALAADARAADAAHAAAIARAHYYQRVVADCGNKYGDHHTAKALARARQYFRDRGYDIPSGGESFDWPPFLKARDGSEPTPEDQAAAIRRAFEEVAREAADPRAAADADARATADAQAAVRARYYEWVVAECEKKYGPQHTVAALARARQYFLDLGYDPKRPETWPTAEAEAAAIWRAFEEVARKAATAGQEELVPKPAPAVDRDRAIAAAQATAARMIQQNPGRYAVGFGVLAWGCLLILSGIILVAVRPRQREIPARLPLGAPSGAYPVAAQALSKMMTHTGPQQVDDAKPEELSRPQAPEPKQQTPLVPAATPPPPVRQPHPVRTALLVIGIALVGVGLLVALCGVSQHNPYSRSSPGFSGHGFYSSSGGDATAIIGAGVLILITGAGLVVASQFLRRGAVPKQ